MDRIRKNERLSGIEDFTRHVKSTWNRNRAVKFFWLRMQSLGRDQNSWRCDEA